ncbi:MAG: VTC domain-containing protein, partial [Planctomycetaceae bacterium]|nr:VTC domain-containing protein [Planctomycetaceae bacterium]
TYAESFSGDQLSFLEIKRRNDVVVSKDRLSFSLSQLPDNIPNSRFLYHAIKSAQASKAVVTEAQLLLAWYNLHPTALVQYQRFPFVALNDPTFRITFDRNLKGHWRPSHIFSAPPLRRCLPGYTVLELKFNHSIPGWLHSVIQDYELQRTSCSKYATVVQSLAPHPTLV